MNDTFRAQLDILADQGRLRQFRPLGGKEGAQAVYEGRTLLNMTSNDYLGIAGNMELHRDFYSELGEQSLLERYALGAASSRLLTGDSVLSHQLEKGLCRLYDRPACLLFNSGYHANIGILPTITSKKDLVLSDKLNHASIHDGMLLSRAHHKRYRHLDYDHLRAILLRERHKYERAVIVSESVFSMDGDVADLLRLVELKKEFDCLLYIDEAHAVGVYGDKGLGKAEEYGVTADIDMLVGTFGKAWASIGAFVVCSDDICEYLINFSRSLIFTTALPPVVTAWNLFILERIAGMGELRRRLRQLSATLRDELTAQGLTTAGSTNIVPVIIGDNATSVAMARRMQDQGYLIFAVRPPTVPAGTARFRLSLTAAMRWQDLQRLPSLISEALRANED